MHLIVDELIKKKEIIKNLIGGANQSNVSLVFAKSQVGLHTIR